MQAKCPSLQAQNTPSHIKPLEKHQSSRQRPISVLSESSSRSIRHSPKAETPTAPSDKELARRPPAQ